MNYASSTVQADQSGLAPLYVTSMVCSMGMMGFVAAAGPLATALGLEAWQVAFSATAGGIGWVLSARFWGKKSDDVGRKRVLLIGILGYILGFIALCCTVYAGIRYSIPALYVLVVLISTRFGMGLSYSAVPAAGAAAIADRFSPENRAGAMGRLAAAQSSGMLFGPAMVAVLADTSPVNILFLLALLSIPAIIFVWLKLPNDQPRTNYAAPQLSLGDRRLIRPLLVGIFSMIAVGIAQIIIGFIALNRLSLDESSAMRLAGGALTAVGVSLVIAQLVVKSLNWSPMRLIRVGGSIAAIGFLVATFAASPAALVVAYVIAGFGAGWVFPAVNAYAANAVSTEEQGRAAGSVSSALGLGGMVGPLVGGVLYQYSDLLPYMVAALGFAIAVLIPRDQ